ncbi:MAG: T9SS type A sorting domain-containing protein [Eubacteriales bacterium]
MRQKKLKVSVILLLGLGPIWMQAQTTVPATGGNASGTEGTVNYSVGQVIYNTHTGPNGSVAHGVLQPFEISVISGVEELKGINLRVSAYPNPSTDFLQLEVDASTTLSIQSISYQLFDMNGKPLVNKKLEGKQTSIVMSNLVPTTYFLKVIQDNKEVKRFKIIKN